MAIPVPTIANLSGAIFQMTSETGQIINGFDLNSTVERLNVFDASLGYDVGAAFFNFTQTGSVKGLYTANSGPGAATPGTTLTLGNSINYNGFSSGGTYIDSVSRAHSEKGFAGVTSNFTRKAGFT